MAPRTGKRMLISYGLAGGIILSIESNIWIVIGSIKANVPQADPVANAVNKEVRKTIVGRRVMGIDPSSN